MYPYFAWLPLTPNQGEVLDVECAGLSNSQARVDGGTVSVDANGDGIADITIGLNGLTSALQLMSSDFVFV